MLTWPEEWLDAGSGNMQHGHISFIAWTCPAYFELTTPTGGLGHRQQVGRGPRPVGLDVLPHAQGAEHQEPLHRRGEHGKIRRAASHAPAAIAGL